MEFAWPTRAVQAASDLVGQKVTPRHVPTVSVVIGLRPKKIGPDLFTN